MTTSTDADAAPTSTEWHSINWKACHEEVKKLQRRIAKATRGKRWRKVNSLQWLLTHSFSAKAISVRRVTENKGNRTAGVDGILWSTPQTKSKAITQLRRQGYQPLPLKRVYIRKSNNTLRPLGIPVMLDRAMQALYLLALEPVSESTADWNSYGFRPGRSTQDAISHLFVMLSRKGAASWVLEGDIKGCFDNISHKWILDNVMLDKKMLEYWLKAGYVDKGKLFPTNEGTPQGGIISPTLANLVLDGLETLLATKFGSLRYDGHSSRTRKFQVHFVRYADDFIITGKSKSLLENEVRPLVREFLLQRGLTLSEQKTKVTHLTEGFDFLGQNVRKYRFGKPNEKLLIKPSKKNVQAFKSKVKTMIVKQGTPKQVEIIDILNPIILGWANYHRHIVAKETFSKVDNFIWRAFWHWACRRHGNKNQRWVKQRYYMAIENRRNMTFACKVKLENGKERLKSLRFAADTKIIRHTKIVGAANPYHPEYHAYFEKRSFVKMIQHLEGKPLLINLWERQKGKCPVCRQTITSLTRWQAHQYVRQVEENSNLSNLCLIHPMCHQQFYQKI